MRGSRGLMMLVLAAFLACALAPTASGAPAFRPRIDGALGLMPLVNRQGQFRAQDVASSAQTPVLYHGGKTMAAGVTVHTIFWAPSGYAFQGQRNGAPAGYEGLIQQFFTDVAADSSPVANGSCTTTECNIFTVESQYGYGTTPGHITPGNYSIAYNSGSNSIDDTNPYPPVAGQCASPSSSFTCVTDGQVAAEIDKLAPPNERGLNNLWYVFLPPNVDECITAGACGTNAFAAYHSVFNLNGHGPTIYAVSVDPIIESTIGPGSDPNNSPDAEAAINGAAHEVNEAMSDPEGVGWLDPNGFENADKCENGPQFGTPLGFAGNDGSPYNQVINGHQYLIQDVWSDADGGCVQATSKTSNPLPLPQVNLTQFSSTVTGNTEDNTGGIGVAVKLLRADANGNPVTVARAATTTAADGSWTVSLAPHAVGDDRDQIDVDYSGTGAPTTGHQVIMTGNGGNAFTESGWTGWFDLDNGSALTNQASQGGPSLTYGPCFQTGVAQATLNGKPITGSGAEIPTDFCNTQTDTSTIATPTVGKGDMVTLATNDNRAFNSPNGPTPNPAGGLVSLAVPVGEADSVSCTPGSSPCAPVLDPLAVPFIPGGFPSCTGDLELQTVSCTGLVAGASYTLTDGSARASGAADRTGTVTEPLAIKAGDSVVLANGARVLTTLHLAHLRAVIDGGTTVLAGGTCQPDQYYGPPLSAPPLSASAGLPSDPVNGGGALTGQICPSNGDATGMPTAIIAQTDELSGGQTQTEVPYVRNTSPAQGEIVYGRFTALAESGLPGPDKSVIRDSTSRIAVRITRSSGGSPVFTAANVDSRRGLPVNGLRPGGYIAAFTLIDVNGDRRVVTKRFIEARSSATTQVGCGFLGKRRGEIRCRLAFVQLPVAGGAVRVTLTRGSVRVAQGVGAVRHGVATVTLRVSRRVQSGAWRATLVLTQKHRRAQRIILAVSVR